MFTVLESQANLTKPPVFVLDLGTDAVWCQRYHCLLGIRKSMPNNGYKVTEVIRDHENLKENEVDTVPLNMPWTAPILHQAWPPALLRTHPPTVHREPPHPTGSPPTPSATP